LATEVALAVKSLSSVNGSRAAHTIVSATRTYGGRDTADRLRRDIDRILQG